MGWGSTGSASWLGMLELDMFLDVSEENYDLYGSFILRYCLAEDSCSCFVRQTATIAFLGESWRMIKMADEQSFVHSYVDCRLLVDPAAIFWDSCGNPPQVKSL